MLQFLAAAALGVAFSIPARWLGERFRLTGGKGVPATGGFAICAAWWAMALAAGLFPPRILGGLTLAMIPLIAIGSADLRKPLGPRPQLLAQVLAAGSAVLIGGVSARYVTHPAGGLLYLDRPMIGEIPILATLVSLAWIVILMNAVNFLDGMDGLASSVSGIGFLTIAAVSFLPQVNEPSVAAPTLIAAGAAAGFLFWNLPPARLYLGTPGSWFLGFLLAVLSLQGSSKIATLAVVGGLPLLDAAAVVLSRLRRGVSPFRGDMTHLHHRLAARGWHLRAILSLYVATSVLLGSAAVFLPTVAKLILLSLAMLGVFARTSFRTRDTAALESNKAET